ncbi:MAG: hypothetical protein Q7S02_02880 [bacterium]|nr:hypothetical protein [bacterium]
MQPEYREVGRLITKKCHEYVQFPLTPDETVANYVLESLSKKIPNECSAVFYLDTRKPFINCTRLDDRNVISTNEGNIREFLVEECAARRFPRSPETVD